jgi:hypothetical protein
MADSERIRVFLQYEHLHACESDPCLTSRDDHSSNVDRASRPTTRDGPGQIQFAILPELLTELPVINNGVEAARVALSIIAL